MERKLKSLIKKIRERNIIKIYTKPNSFECKTNRAIVFAGFNEDSLISDNVVKYLTELRKFSDYIIFVNDNKIIPSELKKIKNFVDVVICKPHKEYDFGSYKIGYFYLKENGILDQVKNLLFCNDSVIYNGEPLDDVMIKSEEHDAYGLTIASYGYAKNKESEYYKLYKPHIQSYYVQISSVIANSDYFYKFIKSIKNENDKHEIIINYEMGLSEVIKQNGYKLNSFYPQLEENINPCSVYLNPNKQVQPYKIFDKKYIINQRKGI